MKPFILTALIFAVCSSIQAQVYTNVKIVDNSAGEPSIAINPKNPAQIVVGANSCDIYYSSDTGKTWNISNPFNPYGTFHSDPVVIVDTAGTFYYFLMNDTVGYWLDRFVCLKSNDGGQTWGDASYLGLNRPKHQDKPYAVVDWSNSQYRNNIYITWTQFDNLGSSASTDSSRILFSKSTNSGATWSTPVRINKVSGGCRDDSMTVEGAVPCVGPNGEIYVSWAGPEGIVFDRSMDAGNTWLENDIYVASQPGGWPYKLAKSSGIYGYANGLPITTCDISNSPYRGTIYINWSDQRNGNTDTDIWLSKSTDNGNSWSSPIRINDDAPGKHQFLTWMTIDQSNGNIYVIFYDLRNDVSELGITDFYMAYSTDGGNTFINKKININSSESVGAQISRGDYTNIAAVNNIVRPVWVRGQNGPAPEELLTALIDNPVGIRENPMPTFSLHQNYPNPFQSETRIEYFINHPSLKITLKVYDILNRELATIIDNEKQEYGSHTIILNRKVINLKGGLYYYMLSDGNNSLSRKFIIME